MLDYLTFLIHIIIILENNIKIKFRKNVSTNHFEKHF